MDEAHGRLRVGIASAVFVAASLAFAAVLREPFGPLRLFVKAIAPVAAVLPAAAVFSAGSSRRAAVAASIVVASAVLTGVCLMVYGVPLNREVLLPMLGVVPPRPAPLFAGVALLAGLALAGLRYAWAPLPARTIPDLLVAVGESLYFGGFLLLSTPHLGAWSWGLVGLALVLAARIRGVSLPRAIAGSAMLVAAVVWSESAYMALLVHIAVLGRGRSAGDDSPALDRASASGLRTEHRL